MPTESTWLQKTQKWQLTEAVAEPEAAPAQPGGSESSDSASPPSSAPEEARPNISLATAGQKLSTLVFINGTILYTICWFTLRWFEKVVPSPNAVDRAWPLNVA